MRKWTKESAQAYIKQAKEKGRICTSIYKTSKRERIDLLECSRLSKAS